MRTASIAAIIVLLLPPVYGFAQQGAPKINVPVPTDPNAPLKKGGDIYGLAGKLALYIAVIFWIFATVSAFYAGYLYLAASGNPEILKKAQKQIWYTVIAIVIGLMAWGLPVLIKNIISPPGGAPGRGGGGIQV